MSDLRTRGIAVSYVAESKALISYAITKMYFVTNITFINILRVLIVVKLQFSDSKIQNCDNFLIFAQT